MVLANLKKDIIKALSEEFSTFEIFGETVKQNFSRPTIIVKLKNGRALKELSDRFRILAQFSIYIFGDDIDRQFLTLGRVSTALENLKGGIRGSSIAFEMRDEYTEIQVSFSFRATLLQNDARKMQSLAEDIRFEL